MQFNANPWNLTVSLSLSIHSRIPLRLIVFNQINEFIFLFTSAGLGCVYQRRRFVHCRGTYNDNDIIKTLILTEWRILIKSWWRVKSLIRFNYNWNEEHDMLFITPQYWSSNITSTHFTSLHYIAFYCNTSYDIVLYHIILHSWVFISYVIFLIFFQVLDVKDFGAVVKIARAQEVS